MGIFDRFKKGKTDKPEKPEPEQKADAAVAETETASQAPSTGHVPDVLVKPLLSEKAMALAGTGRYVFMVRPKAQKPEIKKSVQRIYNVHVEDVKIVNLPAKKRRSGRHISETSAPKKAIVVLKKGETIKGIIESVG